MTRVAIIAAMAGELKPFLAAFAKEGWVHETEGNVQLWRLTWPDQGEWIAACAGAGQAAASRAFAAAEQSGSIDLVFSVGWAGALTGEIAIGQACNLAGVVDVRTGERFYCDAGSGPLWLATSPIVADEAEKSRLAVAYHASLVDMEAAAIARLAAMREIPFYCIKGVSDGVNDHLPDFNRFIQPDGRFRLFSFILFSFLRPWHWPALIRMGENSRKAAHSIAELLLDFLNRQ